MKMLFLLCSLQYQSSDRASKEVCVIIQAKRVLPYNLSSSQSTPWQPADSDHIRPSGGWQVLPSLDGLLEFAKVYHSICSWEYMPIFPIIADIMLLEYQTSLACASQVTSQLQTNAIS